MIEFAGIWTSKDKSSIIHHPPFPENRTSTVNEHPPFRGGFQSAL